MAHMIALSFPKPLKAYKTLWGKDEMLVTSILCFSHSVFKRLLQDILNPFRKGLTKYHLTQHFTTSIHLTA